jgi:hypothetical protein
MFVEVGIDKVALPVLRVIAAVKDLNLSAPVIVLEAEDLISVSVRLYLSQLLR